MRIYQRTENGTVTYVSVQEAMAEVNHCMMEGKRSVREMSSGRTAHWITYCDGRSVRLNLVDLPESAPGRRIVTARGKIYVAGPVVQGRFVDYWPGGLLGIPSGPTRRCHPTSRPGTVGRAIWDAVSAS